MGSDLYSAKQFIEAIPGSGGIISTIAKRVGCRWETAKKYIVEKPTVQKAYREECESIVDMAESTLIKSIQKGDTADAKWYLARKGRTRGYVERQEIEQSGEVVIKVVETDD